MEEFLEFVAALFECAPSDISGETAYGEYEKWDSLMMLRLVMEVEDQYKVVIPMEDTDSINTLADIYERYIEN